MLRADLITRALLLVIRVYQRALSPFLGGRCRFHPSCSRYAYACIETHGPLRGSLLSLFRLCKCQPFSAGGFDPPPPSLRAHPAGAHVLPTPSSPDLPTDGS